MNFFLLSSLVLCFNCSNALRLSTLALIMSTSASCLRELSELSELLVHEHLNRRTRAGAAFL